MMYYQTASLLVFLTLGASTAPTSPSSSPTIACKIIQKLKPKIISAATEKDLSLSTYDTNVGTEVDISCLNDGYVVKGANKLTCLPTGEWSAAIPTCGAPTKKKPINMKLIVGLSVGGGCTLLIVIITGVLILHYRNRSKRSKQNSDNRLRKGRDNPSYSCSAEMTRYNEQDTSLSQPPHVFKVWSHDRRVKKFVAAYNFKELIEKGKKTFNVLDPVIVLEEDGTEIEDNAALKACKDKTLQCISRGNIWCRQSRGSLESDAGYKSSNISIESDGVVDLRGDHPSEFGTLRSSHL